MMAINFIARTFIESDHNFYFTIDLNIYLGNQFYYISNWHFQPFRIHFKRKNQFLLNQFNQLSIRLFFTNGLEIFKIKFSIFVVNIFILYTTPLILFFEGSSTHFKYFYHQFSYLNCSLLAIYQSNSTNHFYRPIY